MKTLILMLLVTVAFGYPQFIFEPSYHPAASNIDETVIEPNSRIDPGLTEDYPLLESGPQLEEGAAPDVGDTPVEEEVPDVLVLEEPAGGEDSPSYRPILIYHRHHSNPFSTLFNPFSGFRFGFNDRNNRPDRPYGPPPHHRRHGDAGAGFPPHRRPHRPRPSPFNMFERDFFGRPLFDPFPFRRQKPIFPIGVLPPRNPDTPQEVPDTRVGEPDGGLVEENPDEAPAERPHTPFHPGGFFHNFFRPHFDFGHLPFDTFPADLPPDYSNSTYKVEDVNGTKVAINETIEKKSGDNFNTYFHIKVIRRLPEETEGGVTEEPSDYPDGQPADYPDYPDGQPADYPDYPELRPVDYPEEELPPPEGDTFTGNDEEPLEFETNNQPEGTPVGTTEAPQDEFSMDHLDFSNVRENEIQDNKPNKQDTEPTV